jgi:hypothetical protein
VTIGRYQLLPDAGRHFLSKDESAKAATNYLEDEIRQRVARGAIRFRHPGHHRTLDGDVRSHLSIDVRICRRSISLLPVRIRRFSSDSPLEETVRSELVSEAPAGRSSCQPRGWGPQEKRVNESFLDDIKKG